MPGMGMDVGSVMTAQLMQVANAMEEQIDAEMHKMENMSENDFEALR